MFDQVEDLFRNPGRKIQTIAMAIFVIEVVLAIIGGVIALFVMLIVLFSGELGEAFGLLIAAFAGPIAVIAQAWLTCLLIYGFGELLQTNTETAENSQLMLEIMQNQNGEQEQEETARSGNVNLFTGQLKPGAWRCSCGRANASYVTSCTCGKSKREAQSKSPEPKIAPKPVVTPNPAHPAAAPAQSSGWTCSCGRSHAAYVTSCTCGKSKREVLAEQKEVTE